MQDYHVYTLLLGILFLIISCYLLLRMPRRIKRIIIMRSLAKKPISPSSMGEIHTIGISESLSAESILTPVSRKPCVWYSIEIQKIVMTGKGRDKAEQMKTVFLKIHPGFLLDDAGGKSIVLIDESSKILTN